jgi:AcrR family transcriptional regulator
LSQEVTVLSLARETAAVLTLGDGDRVDDGPAERVVDAALRCVARWGLAKTTLDDIAREAGCGRATVYRLFPGGRDALWDAVVVTEASRFFTRIAARASAEGSLEDVVVAVVTESARGLSGHGALNFLLAHEPEAILPRLAFHHMDSVLAVVGASAGPLIEPWLGAGATQESAARGAEWVARIVLSYLLSPSTDIDLTDDESARRFVRLFVLPGLRPSVRQRI